MAEYQKGPCNSQPRSLTRSTHDHPFRNTNSPSSPANGARDHRHDPWWHDKLELFVKADINCSGMLSGLVNYMWGRGTRFIYYRAQHALADVAVQLVGLRWPTQSVPRSRFSPDLPGWLCWGFKKRSVLGSGGGNKNCCFS
jgi:hypothetical protein